MRPFTESEAREVFARAARETPVAAPAESGLTLDELQEVGRAAGLDPERVAAAARAVRLGAPERRRETRAGLPTGVSHTAFLAAPPSDDLWDALVADARRTFDARGTTATAGGSREWRNGNLAARLEPDGDGSRLELSTRRGGGQPLAVFAAIAAGLAALMVAMSLVAGMSLAPGVAFAVLAALLGGATWSRERAWADAREAQMAGLAERAASHDAASHDAASHDAASHAAAPATTRPAAPLQDVFDRIADPLADDPDTDDSAGRDARRARS